MDKKQILHEAAMESAKAFCRSNAPEYKSTGVNGYASDLVKQYFIAYKAAEEAFYKYKPQNTSGSLSVLK